MKYFLYDLVSGDIKNFVESPDEHTESFIPGLGIISAYGYSEADMDTHKIVDGEIEASEPKINFVGLWQIKNEWLRREQSPILVGEYYLDCDPVSELRIKNTIEAWDELPLILGQMEDENGVRSVIWTLADNTKQRLSRTDLVAILPALITARAVRAAVLYATYQRLKERLDVTSAELYDDATWT